MKNNKVLNIGLWVAQVILFGMFAMAGFMKISQSISDLSQMLPWASEVPALLVRLIGLSEILGALGLLLPSILRVKPNLTPLAAIGLTVVMLLALIFHVTRGEFEAIGMNLILGLIAVFIAWGRSKKVKISPK